MAEDSRGADTADHKGLRIGLAHLRCIGLAPTVSMTGPLWHPTDIRVRMIRDWPRVIQQQSSPGVSYS